MRKRDGRQAHTQERKLKKRGILKKKNPIYTYTKRGGSELEEGEKKENLFYIVKTKKKKKKK